MYLFIYQINFLMYRSYRVSSVFNKYVSLKKRIKTNTNKFKVETFSGNKKKSLN